MRSPYRTFALGNAADPTRPNLEPAIVPTPGSSLLAAALLALFLLPVPSSVMAQQNEPPVADPNGPYTGFVGQSLQFDGSASYDRDGEIIAYEWDFGDGSSGFGPTPTHAYAAAGQFNVALRVTDDGGATDAADSLAAIDASALEVDVFEDTVAVVDLVMPDGTIETVRLRGPTTAWVYFEGDREGDAFDDDGNGQDEVVSELVEMELSGDSALGPVTVRLNPAIRSMGQIEETDNLVPGRLDLPPFGPDGTTADSFFDVFFEIEVLGQRLHTTDPKRMSTLITHKPPAPGNVYENLERIELYDAQGNPTEIYLGAGRHLPNPPPCPGRSRATPMETELTTLATTARSSRTGPLGVQMTSSIPTATGSVMPANAETRAATGS